MMVDVDLIGCAAERLEKGQGLPPGGSWQGERIRRFAPSKIVTEGLANSGEFVKLTANPGQGKGGATYGDNGGTVLLPGTNTVVAIIAYPINYNAA